MATMALMMKTDRVCRLLVLALVNTLSLSTIGTASASATDVGGSISLGAVYTDNVFLLPKPNDQDETVYAISPSLSLDHESQRLSANFRYRFDWYRYSDIGDTQDFHQLDAVLTGTLIQDAFYVDLGAIRSQSLIDPEVLVQSNNLPIANNLTDRDEYYVMPRFTKRIGKSISTSASYRYADVRYDNDILQENRNERADFSIDNYRGKQGITWAARYQWYETDYDTEIPWEYKKATGELGFWINGQTRIFASGGKESAWDDPVDRSLRDGLWEAGFAYKSGGRISAEFAVGERSFGSSWRGNVEFSFRRGAWSFSYDETPRTNGLERFARGLLAEPDEPNDFLTEPGGADRYTSEHLRSRLSLEFRRTDVRVVLYNEKRVDRFLPDGTPLIDNKRRGASASVVWRVGARTELQSGGAIGTSERPRNDELDFLWIYAGANYKLGSNTQLSLNYRYEDQEPSEGSGGIDYISNSVSLFVIYTF